MKPENLIEEYYSFLENKLADLKLKNAKFQK